MVYIISIWAGRGRMIATRTCAGAHESAAAAAGRAATASWRRHKAAGRGSTGSGMAGGGIGYYAAGRRRGGTSMRRRRRRSPPRAEIAAQCCGSRANGRRSTVGRPRGNITVTVTPADCHPSTSPPRHDSRRDSGESHESLAAP